VQTEFIIAGQGADDEKKDENRFQTADLNVIYRQVKTFKEAPNP
jgi:hypothetical protein